MSDYPVEERDDRCFEWVHLHHVKMGLVRLSPGDKIVARVGPSMSFKQTRVVTIQKVLSWGLDLGFGEHDKYLPYSDFAEKFVGLFTPWEISGFGPEAREETPT